MKAIVHDTTNEVKVIAQNITADLAEPARKFTVEGDIKDSVAVYGLKYPEGESLSVADIGDSYPSDWASDKYLFTNGAFAVNPDYIAPTF
jgi:hypothetical protein